jgi:hypothetical protein
MNRSIGTLRSVGTWIAVVTVLLGCTTVKQDGTAAETAQAAPPSDTTFVIDPGDVYPEDWSTPLPPGVDEDAVTFGHQMAGLAFSGTRHTRWRAGKCNGNCPVHVQITTLSPTRPLSPTMPPGSPRAVAQLRNLHVTHTEAYYGLKPVLRAVYYLWVDDVGGKTRVTALEVPLIGKVRAGRQKYLQSCHDYQHDSDSPNFGEADFSEYRPEGPCNGSKAMIKTAAPARLSASLVTRVMEWARIAPAAVTLRAGGGWIDCNSGCCW